MKQLKNTSDKLSCGRKSYYIVQYVSFGYQYAPSTGLMWFLQQAQETRLR